MPSIRQFIISTPESGISAGIVTIKVQSTDVENAYTILELILPPDAGAPLHIHHREDEIFQVIEGSCSVQMEADVKVIEAGSLVILPKGRRHAFQNTGEIPAKFLITAVPGGLDSYFTELDEITTDDEAKINQQVEAINAKYEIEFLREDD